MVSLCFPWYLKVMTGYDLDAISIFYVTPSTFEFIGIFERCMFFFSLRASSNQIPVNAPVNF